MAVRQLPRVTIRALGRSLALWEAVCEVQGLAAHDAFEAVLSAYTAGLDQTEATEVARVSRRIFRSRYGVED